MSSKSMFTHEGTIACDTIARLLFSRIFRTARHCSECILSNLAQSSKLRQKKTKRSPKFSTELRLCRPAADSCRSSHVRVSLGINPHLRNLPWWIILSWIWVKARVVFPVPAIPLSQYIFESPASTAQVTRSVKIFSLVFAVQERRLASELHYVVRVLLEQQHILEKRISSKSH